MLYGALKFLRFCFSFGKAATFVCDVLFMLTSAVALFMFSLGFLNGAVRVYVLLGALTGFLTLRLTVGRWFFCLLFAFVESTETKSSQNVNYLQKSY